MEKLAPGYTLRAPLTGGKLGIRTLSLGQESCWSHQMLLLLRLKKSSGCERDNAP